jgi:hypothetical protein
LALHGGLPARRADHAGSEKYFTAYHQSTYPLTDKDFESRFDLASDDAF